MPKRKNPDVNEIAFRVVREATGEPLEKPPEEPKPKRVRKNPAAVTLGRLGGLKGGPARAAKLTKKRRSAIAKMAAKARWNGHDKSS
jgi:hypothetical protein